MLLAIDVHQYTARENQYISRHTSQNPDTVTGMVHWKIWFYYVVYKGLATQPVNCLLLKQQWEDSVDHSVHFWILCPLLQELVSFPLHCRAPSYVFCIEYSLKLKWSY